MLKLFVGSLPEHIRGLHGYIECFMDEHILETDFSKRVIKTIDNTEVISCYSMLSPVLGSINYHYVSTGAIALILLKYTDEVIPLDLLGDNCFPLLKEIADEKDIRMCTDSLRRLFFNGFTEVYIENTGSISHNAEEFAYNYLEADNLWKAATK